MKLVKDSLLQLSFCWNSHQTWFCNGCSMTAPIKKLWAGHNSKLQKHLWCFMPAQRQQTRETNKKTKKTLNHGWTQSVSFAAPQSIFGLEGKWTHWFLHRSSNPKPDVLRRVMLTSTLLVCLGKKTDNFDFSTFILTFHLRECQSWLQNGIKMSQSANMEVNLKSRNCSILVGLHR